jgi:hypothetical protein
LAYAASETWVGALLEKAFTRTAHVFRKVKLHLTRRCSIVPLRSTGQVLSRIFVVLLRKSVPQKYNLKPAAELNVTKVKQKILVRCFAGSLKQSKNRQVSSSVVFEFKVSGSKCE